MTRPAVRRNAPRSVRSSFDGDVDGIRWYKHSVVEAQLRQLNQQRAKEGKPPFLLEDLGRTTGHPPPPPQKLLRRRRSGNNDEEFISGRGFRSKL